MTEQDLAIVANLEKLGRTSPQVLDVLRKLANRPARDTTPSTKPLRTKRPRTPAETPLDERTP